LKKSPASAEDTGIQIMDEDKNCKLLFFTFNVTAYSEVRSCTKIYNGNIVVEDLGKESLEEIWNGKEMQTIRRKKT
jgi:hypothetical protein